MKRTKITEELKNTIIEYYLSKPMSFTDISKKFDICLPTIGKILKDFPKYSKVKIYNPELIENFFENIDCEEKAYFLGLLISDGNVFIPKDKHHKSANISITLQNKDNYILETFKSCVNTNVNLSQDNRGCSQISIKSNKMASDLRLYGIIPQKSFYTYLPNINNELYCHLIRGIMDGDGSIQFFKSKTDNKTYKRICFCGTHQLMQDISDKLMECLDLKQKPVVYDYKNKRLSEIHIQNTEDVLKYCNWIYKDASLYLKRKYSKFLEILQYYKHDNTEVTLNLKG